MIAHNEGFIGSIMKKLSPNLVEIINILSDGGYHDGDTIGSKLNITRSAVWKFIKKLDNYGIKLSSIKGKGYALLQPLILLNENYLKKALTGQNIDIEVFESIISTNEYLNNFIGATRVKICLAEHQTGGLGRLGRSWHSPFGQNIYLSCLYPFAKDISELVGLSLVVGLAIITTLKSLNLSNRLLLKWPNDILYEDKKLCGNLIKIQAETNGLSYAIIGIGINVNMADDQQNINQLWISLQKILGKNINRNQLCVILINNLMSYLDKFNKQGFSSFTKEWEEADGLLNKKISLQTMDKIITGYARGINAQGNLLIETEDNSVNSYSSGDTSVLKSQ